MEKKNTAGSSREIWFRENGGFDEKNWTLPVKPGVLVGMQAHRRHVLF